MLAAAQRRAERQDYHRERPLPAEIDLERSPIDQPAASTRRRPVPLGLRAARRSPDCRTPGHPPRAQAGRASLALAAWTGPDDNLWSAAPLQDPGGQRGSWRRLATQNRRAWPRANPETRSGTRWRPRGLHRAGDRSRRLPVHYDRTSTTRWVTPTQMSTRTGDADKQPWISPPAATFWPIWSRPRRSPFYKPDDSLIRCPARTWVSDRDRIKIARHLLRQRRRPGPAEGQDVAIIGYGSQGHAHAQNLSDSGGRWSSACAGARTRSSRQGRGFEGPAVERPPSRATSSTSCCPTSCTTTSTRLDQGQHRARQRADVSHGFNIHFGQVEPPAGVDIALVAPKGPGHLVRSESSRAAACPA